MPDYTRPIRKGLGVKPVKVDIIMKDNYDLSEYEVEGKIIHTLEQPSLPFVSLDIKLVFWYIKNMD